MFIYINENWEWRKIFSFSKTVNQGRLPSYCSYIFTLRFNDYLYFREERKYYYKKRDLAKASPLRYLSLIIDGMDQCKDISLTLLKYQLYIWKHFKFWILCFHLNNTLANWNFIFSNINTAKQIIVIKLFFKESQKMCLLNFGCHQKHF